MSDDELLTIYENESYIGGVEGVHAGLRAVFDAGRFDSMRQNAFDRPSFPAVPDAPGVVTHDVFVVLERNGDFDHVQYSQSHADEIVDVYPDRSYVPATLSYRHPVPEGEK